MKRLLCAALLLLFLTGCSQEPARETIFCMDTVMELTVWGRDAHQAAAALVETLNDLEQTWSVTRDNSLLCCLNRGEAPELTADQAALLSRAEALSLWTNGAFNPHMQPLSQSWGFYGQGFRLPSPEEIAQAREEQGWDLGAALKGYAGQLCADTLSSFRVERALLSLGGNVQTWGEKPDGSPWLIGIQNPDGGEPLGILHVQGTMSVVTSGDYQRCFEADGVRYHHILDPATGYPADSGLASVTVLCRDGLTADTLSTALFVMGLEQGADFWRENRDFEAVFVTSQGQIYATQGIDLSGCSFEVISR